MQNEKYVAAIDQGTAGTRCAIFDHNARLIGWAYKKHKQIIKKEGYIEQDPIEIIQNVRYVINAAVKNAKINKKQVFSIGISNQRETIVAWNKRNSLPIYNAISWQDTRTKDYIKKINKKGITKKIKDKTGLRPSTYFSASKIQWLLKNSDRFKTLVSSGDALVGNMDSWIVWNLTNGKMHYTDYTNASRTMLMNLRKLDWDSDLMNFFGIPRDILPDIVDYGKNNGFGNFSRGGFNTVIGSVMGDQQAALFGERCLSQGDIKITYGTGSFILQNTGKKIINKDGLISTCAYSLGKNDVFYALEGSIPFSGAIFDWLKNIGIIKSFDEIDKAIQERKNNGIYFVPAFNGLLAPYWDENAKGLIIGLTNKTDKLDIISAATNSICLQVKDIINRMNIDENINIKVDGGVSINNKIMQLQSDFIGRNIYRQKINEASSLGAAFSAGLNTNFWEFNEIKNINIKYTSFRPLQKRETINKVYSEWLSAIKRSLSQ